MRKETILVQRLTNKGNSSYPQMPYDLIKELFIALGIMGGLVLILAAVFSTPDVPVLSAKQVVNQDPKVLVQTALDDLSQQDPISTYGQPYNNTPGAAPSLGPISPQVWGGVHIPINSAQTEVLSPLQSITSINPALIQPLQTWSQATAKQQASWIDSVNKVLPQSTLSQGQLTLQGSALDYGPVPELLNGYLSLAKSGLLESAIDGVQGPAAALDRTKSMLLLQDQADQQYADKLNMTGDQWGIIKETGNYPGAVWLWYYTMLYQIPPFNSSDAADLLVVLTVLLVTLALMFTPFIPGLRSLPKWLKIYRFIWRDYYKNQGKKGGSVR